jgi:hypothetical protein
MSIYAKINSDNIVENIIECSDSMISEIPGYHVKVTENTKLASIGYSFDAEAMKFISPKPFDSWVLNEEYDWESPTGDKLILGKFWNEESQEWVQVPNTEE